MKYYVVEMVGDLPVDTRIAVVADSPEEAQKKAMKGYSWDIDLWTTLDGHDPLPKVVDVREESAEHIRCANQTHLLEDK